MKKYANRLEIKKYGNKLKMELSDHRTKAGAAKLTQSCGGTIN